MEIAYSGGNTFRIEAETPVILNPLQKVATGLIALYTTRQRSPRQIVNGPGEYEISGVLIAVMPLGPAPDRRLAHVLTVDGMNVLFVDGPPAGLDVRARAEIGPVDILIINSEDVPDSLELIRELTPRVVLPFGAQAPVLCAALGVANAEPTLRFRATAKNPKAVLLKAPGRGRAAA